MRSAARLPAGQAKLAIASIFRPLPTDVGSVVSPGALNKAEDGPRERPAAAERAWIGCTCRRVAPTRQVFAGSPAPPGLPWLRRRPEGSARAAPPRLRCGVAALCEWRMRAASDTESIGASSDRSAAQRMQRATVRCGSAATDQPPRRAAVKPSPGPVAHPRAARQPGSTCG
jgi:hypothetical protein